MILCASAYNPFYGWTAWGILGEHVSYFYNVTPNIGLGPEKPLNNWAAVIWRQTLGVLGLL